MIGPKNYPTPLQQVHFDTDLMKHQRKLEEIHKSNKNKEFIEGQATSKDKLCEARERGIKFHNSEKLLAIEKDNELLLGKLVEIARKKKTAADFKADKHHVGTLNAPHRKREKDRIAAENEAFAKRLLSQQASFNRKKLDLDYDKHNNRVKQMQKVPMFSPRKQKLPPIEEELRKSKNGNASKAEKKSSDKEDQVKDEKVQQEQLEKERIEKEQAELKVKQEREEKERKEEQERKESEEKEKEAKEKAEKEEVERKEKEEAQRKAQEEAEMEEAQRLLDEKAKKEAEKIPEDIKKDPEDNERTSKADLRGSKNDVGASTGN